MDALRKNHKKFISLKLAKKIALSLTCIIIFESLFFAMPTLAMSQTESSNIGINNQSCVTISEENPYFGQVAEATVASLTAPAKKAVKVKHFGYYTMTAYSSDQAQTDNDPCTTANGFNVCKHGIEDTIAANFLPFGTKIRIPEFFGDKIFTVRDRMNSRFPTRVDIWMFNRSDALNFGIKTAKLEIVE